LKFLKSILIFILILIVLFFSWLKNPNFDQIAVIPSWLNNWSNLHGRIRTAVPFIPLGFILNTYRKKWKLSISGLLLCLIVVVIAELGQYLIPTRYPDIFDVLFGILGALLGMSIHLIINLRETKI